MDGAPATDSSRPSLPGDDMSLSHHAGAGKEVVMEISYLVIDYCAEGSRRAGTGFALATV